MSIDHSIKDLADKILRDAEQQSGPGVAELRQRLEMALSDYTAVSIAAAAGQDVQLEIQAVRARLAALEAAGLVIAAGTLTRAINTALLTGIRLVFSALA